MGTRKQYYSIDFYGGNIEGILQIFITDIWVLATAKMTSIRKSTYILLEFFAVIYIYYMCLLGSLKLDPAQHATKVLQIELLKTSLRGSCSIHYLFIYFISFSSFQYYNLSVHNQLSIVSLILRHLNKVHKFIHSFVRSFVRPSVRSFVNRPISIN